MINFMLDFYRADVHSSICELFYYLAGFVQDSAEKQRVLGEFERYISLERKIDACIEAKFEKLDWQWLHESGRLCLKDYYLFDELKDLKDEGKKLYMEHGTQEIINRLEEEYKEAPKREDTTDDF